MSFVFFIKTMMNIEFPTSSAILSPIVVNEDNTIAITYVSNPDKQYTFAVSDDEFVPNLQSAIANEESVGRFVAIARKRGGLTEVVTA
jgi:hypothetical protein